MWIVFDFGCFKRYNFISWLHTADLKKLHNLNEQALQDPQKPVALYSDTKAPTNPGKLKDYRPIKEEKLMPRVTVKTSVCKMFWYFKFLVIYFIARKFRRVWIVHDCLWGLFPDHYFSSLAISNLYTAAVLFHSISFPSVEKIFETQKISHWWVSLSSFFSSPYWSSTCNCRERYWHPTWCTIRGPVNCPRCIGQSRDWQSCRLV